MMINEVDMPTAVTLCMLVYLIWAAVTWPTKGKFVRHLIGVPPRLGVKAIARHNGMWIVWTGITNMQVPYTEWRGTYIALHDDGTARSVTVQPDGSEDTIRIK